MHKLSRILLLFVLSLSLSTLPAICNGPTYAPAPAAAASAPERVCRCAADLDTDRNAEATAVSGTAVATATAANSADAAQQALTLINRERAAYGLAPLAMDPALTAAAAVRAEEISVRFSHTPPDGTSCFSALQQANASYRQAGENIALGYRTPAAVVQAWMDSPGHRANILNGAYHRIGIAVAANRAAAPQAGYACAQFFAG